MNGDDAQAGRTDTRGRWPIRSYWPNAVEQHWYISFCLLMSAIQDHLSGLALRAQNNLNWATTCHYYSMVHTGRLLCFCVTGDYPTGHGPLRMFLASAFQTGRRPAHRGRQRQQQPRERCLPFDWLKDFQGAHAEETRVSPAKFAAQIEPDLWSNKPSSDDLRDFAAQLDYLGELRTDTNYESLIIAHEKRHEFVGRAFRRLVDAAQDVAHRGVALAVNVYRAHLLQNELFENRRNSFIAASNSYVVDRLKPTLEEKFACSEEIIAELIRMCEKLEIHEGEGRADRADVKAIEEEIMFRQFQGKQALMINFFDKINDLRTAAGIETGIETGT